MLKYRGLFVGLTTIDIQHFLESFPGPNKKTRTEPPRILVGGPATNAAVSFSHLNGDAFLSSANGRNPFNEFIKKDFLSTNVRFIDLAGDRDFDPVIVSIVTSLENGDRNVFGQNPKTIQPEITPEKLLEITKPQIILLDGFYPEFSIDCARLASRKQIPVVLDCGSWKPQYEKLFDFTDIAICSEDFLPPGCISSEQVFEYLKQKEITKIAISRGEKNILMMHGNQKDEITVDQIQVVDTMGAGDFLHGAFCYFYLKTKGNIKNSLISASKIATFSCRFKGTRDWLNITE